MTHRIEDTETWKLATETERKRCLKLARSAFVKIDQVSKPAQPIEVFEVFRLLCVEIEKGNG